MFACVCRVKGPLFSGDRFSADGQPHSPEPTNQTPGPSPATLLGMVEEVRPCSSFEQDHSNRVDEGIAQASLGISLRSATEPIDDTSTGQLMEGVLAAFAH